MLDNDIILAYALDFVSLHSKVDVCCLIKLQPNTLHTQKHTLTLLNLNINEV